MQSSADNPEKDGEDGLRLLACLEGHFLPITHVQEVTDTDWPCGNGERVMQVCLGIRSGKVGLESKSGLLKERIV
jgi:hypothetical protein